MNGQLVIKDEQIKALQIQLNILTNCLNDETKALSAEPALHAGTMQKQFAKQCNIDGQFESRGHKQLKKSFLSKLFERKK